MIPSLCSMLLGSAGASGLRVQDVFSISTYLPTGPGYAVTTGVDLNTYGGMLWLKDRSAVVSHYISDSARGAQFQISSDSSAAELDFGNTYSGFTTTGFKEPGAYQAAGDSMVGWSFRKAPKFFDVVTFTTDGTANQRVPHGLGVAPGMVIIKSRGSADPWFVYHATLLRSGRLQLQSTSAYAASANFWGTMDPTTIDFGIKSNALGAGLAYVAYVFAHDPSPSGIIQCGSFVTGDYGDGTGPGTVSLGWQPQYVMLKPSSVGGSWIVMDTTRGWAFPAGERALLPNSNGAEFNGNDGGSPSSTGFTYVGAANSTYIYMAIRKGPM